MKSKSGPPKGSKNASKGGRDAFMSLRVPSATKKCIEDIAKESTSLGTRATPSDIANAALKYYVYSTYPEIAEAHDL